MLTVGSLIAVILTLEASTLESSQVKLPSNYYYLYSFFFAFFILFAIMTYGEILRGRTNLQNYSRRARLTAILFSATIILVLFPSILEVFGVPLAQIFAAFNTLGAPEVYGIAFLTIGILIAMFFVVSRYLSTLLLNEDWPNADRQVVQLNKPGTLPPPSNSAPKSPPSAPPPTSTLQPATIQQLWERIIATDKSLNQGFATLVVGIGALFFAYGQVYSTLFHLRMVIAAIGLGASFIMIMTFHNGREDKEHLESLLQGTEIHTLYKASVNWREKGLNNWLYFRATRLIEYFSILLTMMWLMIFATDVLYAIGQPIIPWYDDAYLVLSLFAFLAALAIYYKLKDRSVS